MQHTQGSSTPTSMRSLLFCFDTLRDGRPDEAIEPEELLEFDIFSYQVNEFAYREF